MRQRMKRLGAWLLLCLTAMALFRAKAESFQINWFETRTGDVNIRYPLLEGMQNRFAMDNINRAIMAEGGVSELLMQAEKSGVHLSVDAQVKIYELSPGQGLVCILIEASGNLNAGKPEHRYTPLVLKLADGSLLTLEAIFPNPEKLRETIAERVSEDVKADLSDYLDLQALEPLPFERFFISPEGISLYYPQDSLTLLSGKSASLFFPYHELYEDLEILKGSLIDSLGFLEKLSISSQSAEHIQNALQSGQLPGLPVKLHQNLQELIAQYGLQYDAEAFPGGQKYRLEPDLFRGSFITSNQKDDNQTVSGIIVYRTNLFGLIPGKSRLDACQSVLGQAQAQTALEDSAAALYGFQAGEWLEYQFGDLHLACIFDKDGVLQAFYLSES